MDYSRDGNNEINISSQMPMGYQDRSSYFFGSRHGAGAISLAAGSWYVAPGGDDGNTCLDPTLPCATI